MMPEIKAPSLSVGADLGPLAGAYVVMHVATLESAARETPLLGWRRTRARGCFGFWPARQFFRATMLLRKTAPAIVGAAAPTSATSLSRCSSFEHAPWRVYGQRDPDHLVYGQSETSMLPNAYRIHIKSLIDPRR
jgi:hypothetical protein